MWELLSAAHLSAIAITLVFMLRNMELFSCEGKFEIWDMIFSDFVNNINLWFTVLFAMVDYLYCEVFSLGMCWTFLFRYLICPFSMSPPRLLHINNYPHYCAVQAMYTHIMDSCNCFVHLYSKKRCKIVLEEFGLQISLLRIQFEAGDTINVWFTCFEAVSNHVGVCGVVFCLVIYIVWTFLIVAISVISYSKYSVICAVLSCHCFGLVNALILWGYATGILADYVRIR